MPAPLPKLDGRFEGIIDDHARGWLYSADAPRTRLEVELVDEGRVVARAIANGFRQSLLESGIGDGKHAFSIPLPASLRDGEAHQLSIREAYTGQELSGGAKPFRAKTSGPDQAAASAQTSTAEVPARADSAAAKSASASASAQAQELKTKSDAQAAREQPTATALSSGSQPETWPRIEGSFDRIEQGRAIGWVFSPDAPGARLEIELLCDGEVISRGLADRFREDLASASIGDGAHGFELTLDQRLRDRASSEIDAREAFTQQILPGSPQQVPAASETTRPVLRAPSIRGHFDDIVNGHAEGWVFSTEEPLRRLEVEILAAGRVVARGLADQLRPDLREAGIADGYCSFSLPVDPFLFDGHARQLSARERTSGETLEGSPKLLGASASAGLNSPRPSRPESAGGSQPLRASMSTDASEPIKAPSQDKASMPQQEPAATHTNGSALRRAQGPASAPESEVIHLPDAQASDNQMDAGAPAPAFDAGYSASAPVLRFQGRLEAVRNGHAEGWALDPVDPMRRLEIEILCDGQLQGRCAADLYRSDLADAGIGDGRHAFSLPLSATLFNGSSHWLFARERGSGQALDGSPLALQIEDEGSATPPASDEARSPQGQPAEGQAADPASSISEPTPSDASLRPEPEVFDGRADANEEQPLEQPAAEQLPTVESELQGCFEGVINGQACGWVLDPLQPEKRVEVELLCDDEVVACATADLEREDLAEATLGDGRHGFRLSLDASLFDGRPHSLSIRELGSQRLLSGSPKPLQSQTPPARVRPADVQGAFESVVGTRATGHAWDSGRPEHRLEIEILCDGNLVARALANSFRRDLYESGIGDGRHAFSAQVSYELFDAKPHWLTAREAYTGKALTHGPHLFEHAKANWPFDLMSRAESLQELERLLGDPVHASRGLNGDACRRQLLEASLCQEMRQTERARAGYRQLLDQLGENPLCYCKLAETWLLDGEPDSALDDYRRAASLPSTLYWAQLGIGNAFKLREQFVEAEDAYQAAARLAPRDPRVLSRLDEIRARAVPMRVDRLLADGRLDEGIRLLKSRLIEEPENPMILDKLGRLLARQEGDEQSGAGADRDEIAAFDSSLRVLELLLADGDLQRQAEVQP